MSRRDIANIKDFISNNLQRYHPEREAVEGSLLYLNTIIKIFTQIVQITQIFGLLFVKTFVMIVFEKICLIYHDNLNFERLIEKLFLIFDRFFLHLSQEKTRNYNN